MSESSLTRSERLASEKKFVVWLAIASVLLAAVPNLLGWIAAPPGGTYLGYQYATDDHMVYAAWMRQAMDGAFFFDNRFTTDAQPGLTVHLYYLVLGQIARFTGIAAASFLARIGFGFAFVFLVWRLVRKLDWPVAVTKLSVGLTVIGGGCGFLVWHTFGEAIVKPSPLSGLMLGRLPTDTWQPEGFVFPSLLTNGLFMVSLCLILLVVISLLEVKKSWKAAIPGAISLGVLMNIHSYDVLLIAFVSVGFLAASLYQRQVTTGWIVRAAVIAAGAVPAALWFANVLQNDAVFQARAATETYSPNFRQVLFGYLPLIALGLVALASPPQSETGTEDAPPKKLHLIGVAILAGIILLLAVFAGSHSDGYFISRPMWGVLFVASVAAVTLLSSPSPARNMIVSWAIIGLVAIYFPMLFQRKLAMGLSIPWAILAASGLSQLLKKQERPARNLAMSLALILLGATSIRWLTRELEFVGANVSRTSVHPVFLTQDTVKILDFLNKVPGKKTVVAPPGVPSPTFAAGEQETKPRASLAPVIPDLNPIASGLTGAYTYAGHWSETPKYSERRNELSRIFFGNIPLEERSSALQSIGADYVIALNPSAFPNDPIPDLRPLGEVVLEGSPFLLIKR